MALFLSLAFFTLAGCTTNDTDSGGGGYYSTEPVRPVDRAVNLQNQLGASSRSLY
ncbi:MAG: hypothetical protein P1U86_07085 [Verrucomicrobiales bacterium]|nr:hypothetical protein [Verrucomicrobiales bacterium]